MYTSVLNQQALMLLNIKYDLHKRSAQSGWTSTVPQSHLNLNLTSISPQSHLNITSRRAGDRLDQYCISVRLYNISVLYLDLISRRAGDRAGHLRTVRRGKGGGLRIKASSGWPSGHGARGEGRLVHPPFRM